MDQLLENVTASLEMIKTDPQLSKAYTTGEFYFMNEKCLVLSYAAPKVEILVEEKDGETKIQLEPKGKLVKPVKEGFEVPWDGASIAALLKMEAELGKAHRQERLDHLQYTREGMMHRVLEERRLKAIKEDFRVEWAENIYGDHWVYNTKGQKYRVFLRNFDREIGYSDSPDAKTNKLGTTKHIMAAYLQLKNDPILFERLDKTFPFI